jgi:fructokinase
VLRDRLAHEGIELVDAGDGRATTIAESRRTADTVSYSFSSSVPSGLLALADAHLELIRTAPVVVMSAMRAGQRLGALLGTLDAAQGLSLYDPNPRPRTSADLIAHRAEFEEISRRADIVKVAREDLELLFDRPAEETIDRLRTRVGVLLVSDGPRGIVLHAGRARIAVPSSIRAERVVDPLGAGDATLAAVAVQLAGHGVPRTERGWRGVLTFAMRVAAIVCATPGGAMSMPAADALT